ncbi:HvfX family Cu-binding RiPP maturation protein [Psychrobacter lutiphocae]|uniref:HvfX family Cu-binding RiPP maturation protein n=1 Tax=Psychrobacter lutiphocae TaxID=540500 RepID=UPI000372912F|nr:DoxX family protein [Psychrobacter lutiphocae]
MSFASNTLRPFNAVISRLESLDFIAPLAIRLYLAPIFISAGWNKVTGFDDIVQWFGNSDWGLGLPMPMLMAVLVILAELVGGIALLLGLGTRFVSFSLIITMLVAMFSVHWVNGWYAITPTNPDTSLSSLMNMFGFWGSEASLENTNEAALRLDKAREILQTHGNYDWLTETGNFVILNNGIEFAATYTVMLLVTLFYGAGRYVSIDYWLNPSASKRQYHYKA